MTRNQQIVYSGMDKTSFLKNCLQKKNRKKTVEKREGSLKETRVKHENERDFVSQEK
jgi:hypothetical protein